MLFENLLQPNVASFTTIMVSIICPSFTKKVEDDASILILYVIHFLTANLYETVICCLFVQGLH